MVICLERGAELHMAQLMQLPLTVSCCFSKIQIGSTFFASAHLGSPGKGPLNGCVCKYILISVTFTICQRSCRGTSRSQFSSLKPVIMKSVKCGLEKECFTARCVVSVEILPIATQQCRSLCLAVLVELRLVTDRQTDRHRHRQTLAHG